MSNISGGSLIAMTAVAGATVVGAAWWYTYGRAPVQDVPAETVVAVAPESTPEAPKPAEPNATAEAEPVEEPEAAEETVAEADPQPEVQEAPPPRPVAFDEVRREEDGMTIIAGRADPGAPVEVLLDGEAFHDAKADRQGKFAAIMMIAPDGLGHVLSLVQIVDGVRIPSEDQIILAPLSAPVEVAEAAPEAPSAPVETDQSSQQPKEVAETSEVAQSAPQAEVSNPTTDQTVAQDAPASEGTTEQAGQEVETTIAEADEETQNATAEAAPQQSASLAAAPEAPSAPEAAPEPPTPLDITLAPAPAAEQSAEPTVEASNLDATQSDPEPKPAPKVAVLKSTKDGVELLNVPRPDAMENVALDTISYSEAGEVQLAGRAQSDTSSVRVYLNNRSVVSLAVDDQGRWRGDLPDVDEGIYTLRVDEVADDGTVTSRVETPFKRESPKVLAEAAAEADGPLRQITVQKGATLWAIARDRYGDGLLYVNVFRANSDAIRDPDLIYPGQVFDLPD